MQASPAMVLAALLVAIPALPQESRARGDVPDSFASMDLAVNHELERCELAGKLIFLRVSLGISESGGINWDCIAKGKSIVSGAYRDIKGQLADKDALTVLNDYAATALAAFDEVQPRQGEREREYIARVGTLRGELRRKANLFKLQLQ